MKRYVLLMCAGAGSRTGLSVNKLLYKIHDKAVVEYTLDNFAAARADRAIDEIFLVCSEADRKDFERIAEKYRARLCSGGKTRSESVRRGLSFLRGKGAADADIVLICDGARPNTSPALIAACAAAAEKSGGAVAAYPVADTLRAAENGVFTRDIPRENVCAVQTPQAFRFGEICAAYSKINAQCTMHNAQCTISGQWSVVSDQVKGKACHSSVSEESPPNKDNVNKTENCALNYTDDGGVYAATGYTAEFVPGSPDNYKITLPEDLQRFEREVLNKGQVKGKAQCTIHNAQLKECPSSVSEESQPNFSRVGIGSDTHRLVSGHPLILGGVHVPHDKGLLGHSDADVLTHAIMDALLSAVGLRDIGFYFPDGDPKYKDADSLRLLAEVRETLERANYKIGHISAVISAESPRLSPYIDDMRARLAAVLEIQTSDIGIGAKSGEGLGFVGRKEGIAVTACATIYGR
ncbi:hypothetical protein FACS1894211_11100 [Clostridia bacterium]|nr:hypothetical protein FACS1894211_11100 [Clostridia bacterium]